MNAKNKAPVRPAALDFIFRRTFAAPRELVFQAWTDPAHLAKWWGPAGFTNPVCEWDPRPGGKIYDVMRAPNGIDFPMGGVFHEVDAPRRVVFSCGALDEKGVMLFEFLHTVTLTSRTGQTLLALKSRIISTRPGAEKYLGGFKTGMTLSLVRLAEHVTAASPLVVERIFAAPVARVWAALTDPAALKEWFFEVDGFAPKLGAEFRFTGEKDGEKYFHRGRITAVVPRKKLAFTWQYVDHAGSSLVTIELVPAGAGTKLRLTHEGLESLAQFSRANFQKGWTHLIGDSLPEYLEETAPDRVILITRVVAAPRERVWEAMTDPAQVAQWWGPRGFTTTIEKMDLRPGGIWKMVMHGPDGTDYPNKSVFREIMKPERIVFDVGGGKKGGPGVRFVSTWRFDAVDVDRTRVTIRMVFPTAAARDTVVNVYGAIKGGKETLVRLDKLLRTPPTTKEFVIRRVFDAPRTLVWWAWTDLKQLQQWFGPKGFIRGGGSLDLRPGGVFHYSMAAPTGQAMWGKWIFKEIVPPEKLVFISSFSDAKGGVTRHPMSPTWPLEMLTTTTLTERRGKTTLTLRWAPYGASADETRTFDAARDSMNQGWTGTLDQLTAHLAKQP